MTQLSIIIPAYNEQAGIAAALAELGDHILTAVPDAEVIVVDDGSTDDTAAIVRADPRIRLLQQENAGHGAALNAGVAAASADVIMVLDADGQVPLAGLGCYARLVIAGELPAVMMRRRNRRDGALRGLLTGGLTLALALKYRRWVPDANVPCKILRRSDWRADAQIPSALTAVRLAEIGAIRPNIVVRKTRKGLGGGALLRTAVQGIKSIYS
ncbi:glycosyltransferase family 2 protein [Ketogulonicigenium vulgare]|uniref:Glycosyl transferase family 2 n=1 Tax=Ketogulonicigenium vulgare (strain WSH-001) TaxID=759362 RepID=F9YAE8_KETVW|nr:glycosyltransferase [Ketogulonicigenium vulgare]ADO42111.1 probable dolichol-phosphate mannosyltransferase-putative membrane bound sugar transferase involved in LPS biosynthesis [Ketogulonicigenium vulgare Y25]AEM40321.1 Glycosyl transferase family 2 [Ketogulonicigenium vulgare WSH-001]ALJ80515.1 glycosyl transferase [Ketogulonicigenium vulgare]ANW33340.1 glycosyl transferase [Ketogulonicigenium vulgare]AOZ54031.1 dolichol-phosphate mannosyltransferase- membrane bound sugar transferase invo